MNTVAEIPDDYTFVVDVQDIGPIRDRFDPDAEYDTYFVQVQDGDYAAVYGIMGIVPSLSKPVTRLTGGPPIP